MKSFKITRVVFMILFIVIIIIIMNIFFLKQNLDIYF